MRSLRSVLVVVSVGALFLTGYLPATPAHAASGDLVITMTVPNMDPSLMQNVVTDFVGKYNGLSNGIQNVLNNYNALVPSGTVANPGESWPGCGGCTLEPVSWTGSSDTATVTLTVDIPAADVHTNLEGWVVNIIAGTLGTLAGLVAGSLCSLAFPVGGPPIVLQVCAPVFAFVSGMAWTLIAAALTGKSLGDPKTWALAIGSGVLAVAGAVAIGPTLGWASSNLRDVLILLGNVIGNSLRTLFGWLGSGVSAVATAVAGVFAAIAGAVYDVILAVAQSVGITSNTNLRVMPFGDSITYGVASSDGSGYRCDLQSYLTAQGDFYQFVGSLSAGTRCQQENNEGHSGWTIDQLSSIENCTIHGFQPNIVLLDIGTNDYNNNYQTSTAPARIENLINKILADDPGVVVLVSSLIGTPNSTVSAGMYAFNQQVSAWASQQAGYGVHVAWVDQGAVRLDDLADGLHPNDTGYQKMAVGWNIAIDTAIHNGWIVVPNAQGTGCAPPPPPSPGAPPPVTWVPWGTVATGVGGISPPIWQPMGKIATGVGVSGSQIQFANVFGSGRADYLDVEPNSSVKAWYNSGAGSNGAPNWIPEGTIAAGVGAPGSQIQFADIAGSGRADYLWVHPDSSVSMWENAGPGSNGLPVWIPQGVIASGVGAPGSQIQFADLTGNGRADYLDIQPNSSVIGYQNPGLSNLHNGGGWIPLGTIASGVGAPGSQIHFADVTGSGRADYLNVQPDSSVIAYYNPGLSNIHNGNGWVPLGEIATGVGAPGSQIQFADLTGNGRADYLDVQSDSSVLAWYNNPGAGGQIQFAPVYGTGRADYLDVLPDSSVNAWYNASISGQGVTWVGPIQIASGVGAPGSQIRFASITGDGRADYLWVHSDSSVSMWFNAGPGSNGAPTWLPEGTIATGVGAPGYQIQFADITGGGRADYLWVHPDSSVTMWQNPGINAVNPNGIRWNGPMDLASGVGAPGDQIRFADLTGNGRADYLWVHGNSSVTAWYNPGLSNINTSNGFGWVPWGVIATGVGAPGSEIQFADLTGSGRADYLDVRPNSAVDMWYNASP